MSGFGSLDELARRPEAPILVVHIPTDLASERGPIQLAAARKLYGGFIVLPLYGADAYAEAIKGRDVVLWPWCALYFERENLADLERKLAQHAKRLRVIAPVDIEEMRGPADLNGYDPIAWAGKNCILIERAEAQPPDEPALELVSGYRPHPDMIEAHEPDPIDLFTKRALPPMRVEYLPPEIQTFVFDQSEIIGSDPCIIALSCLVAAAAACHDSIQLQATRNNPSWRESARLWGMFIGDPSVKKTPALNRAVGHLKKLNVDMAEQSAVDMELYKRELKAHERSEQTSARNLANNKAAGYVGQPPVKPLVKRIIVQDATVEAVSILLKDNHGGFLVLRDELSAFFGGMDAYSRAAGKDAPFWLECYNGGPQSIDRVGRDSITVPNQSVCVLGGIQPGTLTKVAKALPDDGLLQRFMPVIAQPVDGIGQDRAPNHQAVEQWCEIIDWIIGCKARPQQPVFSDGALKVREALEHQRITLQKAHAGNPKLVAHLGKWPALFVRLCLTHYAMHCGVMKQPITGEVTTEIAQRVARFMLDYLYEHTRALHEDLMGDSWVQECSRWIAGFIISRELSEISTRTIYRSYKRFEALPERDRGPIMRALELAGWLTPIKPSNPGVPVSNWEVNSRVHELYGHHAQEEIDSRASAREIIVAARTHNRRLKDEGQS